MNRGGSRTPESIVSEGCRVPSIHVQHGPAFPGREGRGDPDLPDVVLVRGRRAVRFQHRTRDTCRERGPSQALQLTTITLVLFFGGILAARGSARGGRARSFDLPVRAITLVFWGGATETRSWRKGPLADFVVAAAGPATTAVLGLDLLVPSRAVLAPGDLRNVFEYARAHQPALRGAERDARVPARRRTDADGGRVGSHSQARARVPDRRQSGRMLIGGGAPRLRDLRASAAATARAWGIFAGYIGFVMITVGRQIPPRAALRERLSRGTARDAMRPISRPDPRGRHRLRGDGTLAPGRSRSAPSRSPTTDASSAPSRSTRPPETTARALGRRPRWCRSTTRRLVDADEPLDDVVEWVGSHDALVLRRRRDRRHDRHRGRRGWLKAHWRPAVPRRRPSRRAPAAPRRRSPTECRHRGVASGRWRPPRSRSTTPRTQSSRTATGPSFVTGGAGTGKTAVLRERFARLIEGGAEPERVALCSSSRAGPRRRPGGAARTARPRRSRVCRSLTSHGLALRVLKLRERRAARGARRRGAVREGARAAGGPGSGRVAGVRRRCSRCAGSPTRCASC